MSGQRFSSVWEAIEQDEKQVQSMRLRAQLMTMIADELDASLYSDKEISEQKGVNFNLTEDIRNGRIDLLSLDDLLEAARRILPTRVKFTLE